MLERAREREREMAVESTGASKVLVFGGTGYVGSYIVKASVSLGHPTFVFARQVTPETPPSKKELLQQFESLGVNIVYGTLEEQEKLVEVLRQVDVAICAFALPQAFEQFKIIDAIKLAGNIKRFIPSDFGLEEDRVKPLKPFQEFLDKKSGVRRAVRAAGIPYTFVSANLLGAYFMNGLLRPREKPEEIVIHGSGDVKVVYTYEEDVAVYTVKVANDPRTLNRIVNIRPRGNIISMHELISLWEKKTGRSYKKVYVTEEELVKQAETLPEPQNIGKSILHTAYVRGEAVIDFEGGGEEILEASQLYPDYKYTTIDELLDIMIVNPPNPAHTKLA